MHILPFAVKQSLKNMITIKDMVLSWPEACCLHEQVLLIMEACLPLVRLFRRQVSVIRSCTKREQSRASPEISKKRRNVKVRSVRRDSCTQLEYLRSKATNLVTHSGTSKSVAGFAGWPNFEAWTCEGGSLLKGSGFFILALRFSNDLHTTSTMGVQWSTPEK